MILALEGISAVGKSGVAAILADALDLPIFCDPVRHRLLGTLTRREMFLTGNQCNVTLSELASVLSVDVILDRWCLSSYVYDLWKDPSLKSLYTEELLGIYLGAPAAIYLLRLDPTLAFERMRARDVGPVYTLEDLEELDRRFADAAELWSGLGGSVNVVDSTDVEAAASEVIRIWRSNYDPSY